MGISQTHTHTHKTTTTNSRYDSSAINICGYKFVSPHLIILWKCIKFVFFKVIYFNLCLVLNTVKLNIIPYSLVVKHILFISTKFTYKHQFSTCKKYSNISNPWL